LPGSKIKKVKTLESENIGRTSRDDLWLYKILMSQPLLLKVVILLVLTGTVSVVIGTLLGLASFRDVGYPDSAILLRIDQFLLTGQIYHDPDAPPYLVTVYGPLTYAIHAIPYKLAQLIHISPAILVRFAIVIELCFCIFFINRISRKIYDSSTIAKFSSFLAVSSVPLAFWATQIRGDFLALAMSLLSVYLFVLSTKWREIVLSAMCAGIALIIKQTFFSAPISVAIWLIYKRRFMHSFLWSTCVVLTVVAGYSYFYINEPLMLSNILILQQPIIEYKEALLILWDAASHPVVPFAMIGLFLSRWKRAQNGVFLLFYCIVAWLVAIVTVLQVGGNINYFWEPLMASAIFAGSAMYEMLQGRKVYNKFTAGILLVWLLLSVKPMLFQQHFFWGTCYAKVGEGVINRQRWVRFFDTISGKYLLSTSPDITILSKIPEIPDPFLNATLGLSGKWSSQPVVSRLESGAYDLVVIWSGEAEQYDRFIYRGIRIWDDKMWRALRGEYRPACVFEGMEVWLPSHNSDEIFASLLGVGCLPMHTPNRGN